MEKPSENYILAKISWKLNAQFLSSVVLRNLILVQAFLSLWNNIDELSMGLLRSLWGSPTILALHTLFINYQGFPMLFCSPAHYEWLPLSLHSIPKSIYLLYLWGIPTRGALIPWIFTPTLPTLRDSHHPCIKFPDLDTCFAHYEGFPPSLYWFPWFAQPLCPLWGVLTIPYWFSSFAYPFCHYALWGPCTIPVLISLICTPVLSILRASHHPFIEFPNLYTSFAHYEDFPPPLHCVSLSVHQLCLL